MISAFNWIDFLILVLFAVYVWDGYRRGFFRLMWELLGILTAFVFALRFYTFAVTLLKNVFGLSDLYAKPIGFLIIWFLVQLVFYGIGHYLSYLTPVTLKESKPNHYLGLIPAAAKGLMFISVLLILLMILPLSSGFKNNINQSLIGGPLFWQASTLETKMETIFAGADSSDVTLSGATLAENAKLDFTTTDISIDEQSEGQMLSLVNIERQKEGLGALKEDILVRNVARAHDRDMLIRGYFSHDSPSGETLADRLKNAHVGSSMAAENIAIAPTIELAHTALMNSPKHKDNILNPSWSAVGIGVVDAGQYGIMVTQDFIR